MNELFKKNTACIRDPVLLQKIKGIQCPEIFAANGGQANVILDGLPFYANNNPEVIYSDTSFQQGLIWIFHGLGLGYHAKQNLEHLKSSTQSALIIEPNVSLFCAALSTIDFSQELSDPRIQWVVGLSEDELRLKFRGYFADAGHLSQSVLIKTASLIPAIQKNGAYFAAAQKIISETSGDALLNIAGSPEDHLRGLMNLLGNTQTLSQTGYFESLKNRFIGRTGIVVSTGPSLNESIESLKKIRDECVVIAADSALAVLLQHGIKPDFTVCLERVVATQKLFEDLPDLPDVPLVYIPLVYPKTLKAYPGPKLSLLSNGTDYGWLLTGRPQFRLGNSVATMALTCLNILGCKRTLLFGQDLAFKRGSQQSHALGANQFLQEVGASKHDEVLNKESNENWVEGNDGTPILSWEPYRMIARQISQFVSDYKMECFNVIPKKAGIKLTGVIQIEPQELDNVMKKTPLVKSNYDPIDSSSRHDLNELMSRIQHSRQNLERLKNVSLKVIHEMEVFYHEHLPSKVDEKLEDDYLSFLFQAEGILNGVLNTDAAFRSILWPFFRYRHVTEIARYYQLNMTESGFKNKIKPMFFIMRNWFKEVFFLASQIGQAIDQAPNQAAEFDAQTL